MEQEKEKRLLFGTTIKYFNTFDMAFLKLAIIAFTLFAVSAWPAFGKWVLETNFVWFFLLWIIFAIKPIMKAWKK